jgi:hypothetical protein
MDLYGRIRFFVFASLCTHLLLFKCIRAHIAPQMWLLKNIAAFVIAPISDHEGRGQHPPMFRRICKV